MTSKFEHMTWIKLYREERGTFAQLPLLTRGLADELLKMADDDGLIELKHMDLHATICRVMAAHPRERRQVKIHLDRLIEDGFVIEEGHNWRIRNYTTAQSRKSVATVDSDQASKAPARRPIATLWGTLPSAPATPPQASPPAPPAPSGPAPTTVGDALAVRWPCADGALTKRQRSREFDLTSRNHSAGTRASEVPFREEKSRAEEEAPSATAPHTAPTSNDTEEKRTRLGPEACAILAELQTHSVLAPIATEPCAERLSSRVMSKGLESVLRGIREYAQVYGDKNAVGYCVDTGAMMVECGRFVSNVKPPRPDRSNVTDIYEGKQSQYGVSTEKERQERRERTAQARAMRESRRMVGAL